MKKRGKRRKNEKNRGNPRFFRWHLFWTLNMVAGVGFEPHDLRVMSPTSYQAALPRDMKGKMVPEAGIEPVRYKVSRDFKSRASANSATPANQLLYTTTNAARRQAKTFPASLFDSVRDGQSREMLRLHKESGL